MLYSGKKYMANLQNWFEVPGEVRAEGAGGFQAPDLAVPNYQHGQGEWSSGPTLFVLFSRAKGPWL